MAKKRKEFTKQEQDFLKKIGQRIVKARRAKGFKQLDLAAMVGMEETNLSAIENGRQNVTSLTLKKIADKLGYSIEDFFIGINSKER